MNKNKVLVIDPAGGFWRGLISKRLLFRGIETELFKSYSKGIERLTNDNYQMAISEFEVPLGSENYFYEEFLPKSKKNTDLFALVTNRGYDMETIRNKIKKNGHEVDLFISKQVNLGSIAKIIIDAVKNPVDYIGKQQIFSGERIDKRNPISCLGVPSSTRNYKKFVKRAR